MIIRSEHKPLKGPVKSTSVPLKARIEGWMKELTRSNDLVFLSWARALLADSGIETFVLDGHTSVIEGSIGAVQRRLMVANHDHARAVSLLRDAPEQRA